MTAAVTLSPVEYLPPLAYKDCQPAGAEQQQAQLVWCDRGHNCRDSLEQFIAGGFAAAYDARISQFMPHLLAVTLHGQWQAVLGIRSGLAPRLFVEQYLDADICTVLAGAGIATQRAQVAEIGNLYASGRQQTLLLFIAMAVALYQQGYRHLVCCATPTVMSMLSRHGLQLNILAEGDPSRLGDAAADWGSYYQRHPQVCQLDLTAAYQLIMAKPQLQQMLSGFLPFLQCAGASLAEQAGH
jgi:hypothetical protein